MVCGQEGGKRLREFRRVGGGRKAQEVNWVGKSTGGLEEVGRSIEYIGGQGD